MLVVPCAISLLCALPVGATRIDYGEASDAPLGEWFYMLVIAGLVGYAMFMERQHANDRVAANEVHRQRMNEERQRTRQLEEDLERINSQSRRDSAVADHTRSYLHGDIDEEAFYDWFEVNKWQ